MKKIAFTLALLAYGCSTTDELRVTSYRTVQAAEGSPWPSGCLATVESKTQRIIGLYGLPCDHIAIGDKAVFNHKGDTVFWVNEKPYTVRLAEAK